MKNKYVVGALLLVLGLLIAIGPQKIFPVCEFNPEKPMKCNWMGKAEIGVGAAIALIGVLQMVMDHAKVRMGLSMAAVPMGLLTLLLPTKLIGVCMNVHMRCVTLTRPALLMLGIATILVGGLSAFALNKIEK
ncbi:MAG: DUF4418 family protein [Clostridia bacterium]|nr:DUF4418 family protein [Clostridia bacterium]